jgi:hypothetical protein
MLSLACSGQEAMESPPQNTSSAPDAALDSGACGPEQLPYYATPGCGSEAKATCWGKVQDGCASRFCGCDGVTILGGCGTSEKPFIRKGPCDDADLGGGYYLYYTAPGCGSEAKATHLWGIQDQCADVFCGCDGATYQDGCGASWKPFLHKGPCEDASAPDVDPG